jgi:hypothetical protein
MNYQETVKYLQDYENQHREEDFDKQFVLDSPFYSANVYNRHEMGDNPGFDGKNTAARIRNNQNELENLKYVQMSDDEMKDDQNFREDFKKVEKFIKK